MFDPFTTSLILGTFLVAGIVKGVIGLGLPTISLGLLAATLDLTTAMVLLVVPSFVTNLWQAAVGGNTAVILRRTWLFLFTATSTVWVGATALTRLDFALLSSLLGVTLVFYSTVGLAGVSFKVHRKWTHPAGAIFGSINGILTGMTGSFVVPGVLYLQALGFSRDELVQAMGMLFTFSTLALALVLYDGGWIDDKTGVTSAVSVVPAILGMAIGGRIRRQLSEKRFRVIFFVSIFLLGIYIVAKSLV